MEGNWNTVVYNPTILDESERIIQGVATAPVYDRQNELITVDAIRKAIPDFMVLPVLTVQHSQYVAGRVDDVWIDDQDRMCIKAHLKQTRDVDRVWDLIKAGKLNAFSITGYRVDSTCGRFVNSSTPCVTNDLVMNSITICGDNKVNPEAHFDMVIKSIITGEEEKMVEEIATNEPTAPVTTTNVDIAKAVVTELKESGILSNIVKACMGGDNKEEEKKDEKKEEKEDDKLEKAFAELSSKFDTLMNTVSTLQKSVTALEESPVNKAEFAVQDGKIVQVIPQMDVSKAQTQTAHTTSRSEALYKMRLS